MPRKNMLLTAFRNTSAEVLLENVKGYRTLLLPNDKVKDSEILIKTISREQFDYIICFGQRPNIKDKIHIEVSAKTDELCISTNFDYESLMRSFEQIGIVAKLSHNAGTSFCNQLYVNGLKYLIENDVKTKMIFIHIPYMKNISNFERLCTGVFETIMDICN